MLARSCIGTGKSHVLANGHVLGPLLQNQGARLVQLLVEQLLLAVRLALALCTLHPHSLLPSGAPVYRGMLHRLLEWLQCGDSLQNDTYTRRLVCSQGAFTVQ
jgi:hypothetical protein